MVPAAAQNKAEGDGAKCSPEYAEVSVFPVS